MTDAASEADQDVPGVSSDERGEIPGIYLFEDYREYLVWRMNSPPFGRGARQKLAQFIDCQPSFVSQVLSGQNELSLEHAYKINLFLHHEKSETHYFMTMVQLSKAGTFELQKYFRQQLKTIRSHQLQVENFVNKHQLSQDDIIIYYSCWKYIAAHMLVTIERFQSSGALQEKLGLDDEDFLKTMNFLMSAGLVVLDSGQYIVGESHLHLKATSPVAQSASLLTRLKALEKLDLADQNTINYASNFTISKKGYARIKRKILEFIVELDKEIQAEDPEEFCTLVIDLVEH